MPRAAVRRAVLTLCCLVPVVARAATPEQVEAAIQKGKSFLYASMKPDGSFPDAGLREQQGGHAAIAVYALLAAGESRQDPRMQKAIASLRAADIKGIYALGLRAQLWHFLPQTPDVKEGMKKDGKLLVDSVKDAAGPSGMFNYPVLDKAARYDHSVSQYGVLGIWACAQLGFEVPTEKWKLMDAAWRAHQEGTGGWGYTDAKNQPRASMTAAGVASLFIIQDYVHLNKGECNGNIRDPNIDKGLKWMADNFSQVANNYTWYGVERIGVASGYKYFGTIDWYQDGADRLVKTQARNGNWGDVPNTCFAVLFLVRGRAPVVMNKLEYEIDTNGDKPKLANWDQRPRDCANITRWMSKQLEKDLNWQIVNLKVDVDDLHDAPILYVAGNQPLQLSPDAEKKLKQFVEQGGMILGNADCASDAFTNSFEKLGQKLFGYEFRSLPADHLFFTTPFHHSKWPVTPVIRSLSNGAREMMVLIPTADFSKFWQMSIYGGREQTHQLMWNIYFYAIDKKEMRFKGQTYLVHPHPQVKPPRTIPIARLQYGGNWDPEPGGWRRLAAVLHNNNLADLDVKPAKLGGGELLATGAKIAHLTGTTKTTFSPESIADLKKFVDAGGTLIVDACGGDAQFAASMEDQLLAAFPGGKFDVLPPDSPVFAAGVKTGEVTYRAFAKKLVGTLHTPRIKALKVNDRPAIFLSPEDLSTGLVGMSIDGVYGYEPASATSLMRNLILYATPRADTAVATPTPTPPKSTPPDRRPGKRPK